MLVSTLPFENRVPLLAASPLWKRNLSNVKNLDLTVFLRLHINKLQAARSEVQLLINLAWNAMLQGKCQPPEMIFFDIPGERISIGDLKQWLTRLPGTARRQAMLFGLEMGLSSGQLVELEWSDLASLHLTAFAKALLFGQPRHMRLPYVFWEISPAGNIVHPLFGLADDVWKATDGIGYDRLLKLYRDMVPIDSELDLADFSLHIGQVAAHHC